jgi:hypothetical protein
MVSARARINTPHTHILYYINPPSLSTPFARVFQFIHGHFHSKKQEEENININASE